jgi:hypothetical protein
MIPALVMAEKDRYAGRLESDRELFLCQAMRDLVEELGEAQKKQETETVATTNSAIIVLCLPAQSQADEIVGLMLAQLLELKGQRAVAASQVSLASEMMELIETQKAAVVCISALPPAAVSHSRYLCKRLHARFPDMPTVVGLWTSKTNPKTSLERLSTGKRVCAVSSLKDAIAEIREMVQPLLLQQARVDPDVEAKPSQSPPLENHASGRA